MISSKLIGNQKNLTLNKIIDMSDEKFSVPRVSTIIQNTDPPEKVAALRKWEFAQIKKYGEKGAEANRKETLRKGTLLHSDIENFFNSTTDKFSHPHFHHLEGYLYKLKLTEGFTLEKRLFSDKHGFTGKFDFCGSFLGKNTMIDWTTSYRKKRRELIDNKFLQAGAYKILYEEHYQEAVEQLAVFVVYPTGADFFTYPFSEHDNLSAFKKSFIAQFPDPYDIDYYSNLFLERLKQYKEMNNER